MINKEFYMNKRVLITGHTGFKGTWLCKYLVELGANVCGIALDAEQNSLYYISKVNEKIKSVIADIRNFDKLYEVFNDFEPEIVIHLAAQPIVLESYKNPKYTYETNVLGTLNVLECIRRTTSVKSVLNVTTEKVYINKEYKNIKIDEDFPLDGYDPYSNSKSCSELITASYRRCFFMDRDIAISTARASNVLGGGDFAENRIIPDCVRAALNKETIIVRHPESSRPYQYVLDPLTIYLEICEKQYNNKEYQGSYNVCPDVSTRTEEIVNDFCVLWGDGLKWNTTSLKGPKEATFLSVSNEKIKRTFDWHQIYNIEETIRKIVEWTKIYEKNINLIPKQMEEEIKIFIDRCFYE